MANLCALLALTLAAAGGDEIPPPFAPMVDFQVRELSMEGFEWRGELAGHAKHLDWQDGVTVWLVDDQGFRQLLTALQGNMWANVVQAPKMRAAAGTPTKVELGTTTTNFVVDVERIADGPRMKASQVAYQPVVASVKDGISLGLIASASEADPKVTVDLEERRIERVLEGSYPDGVAENAEKGTPPTTVKATFQVPIVAKSGARGTWTVPAGYHLMIDLGPRIEVTKSALRTRERVTERVLTITPIVERLDAAPTARGGGE